VRLIEELVHLNQQPKVLGGFYFNEYLSQLDANLVSGFHLSNYPKKGLRALFKAGDWYNDFHLLTGSPDVIHETYFVNEQPVLTKGTTARVTTIYDALHERHPNLFPSDHLKTKEKQASFDRSDLIFSISNHTKEDTLSLFKVPEEKIKVVHLAADPAIPEQWIDYPKDCDRPFFLFVGIRMKHKNFDRFLQAFASSEQLMKNFDIVSVASYGFSPTELDKFRQLGFGSTQIRHVHAGDQLLAGYYSTAVALVYPSVYEGFGIPPLEAMTYGCPVACSNSSSLPEVVGQAAELFDPYAVEEMKTAMERIAFDEERRAELIRLGKQQVKKFSWEKVAKAHLLAYQTLS
jgi:glycosyltransferase involved in cell wall biosynthesis